MNTHTLWQLVAAILIFAGIGFEQVISEIYINVHHTEEVNEESDHAPIWGMFLQSHKHMFFITGNILIQTNIQRTANIHEFHKSLK